MTHLVPIWLSWLFCGAILTPVWLLARLAADTAPARGKAVFWGVTGTLLAYFGYVAWASLNGLFSEAVLPPAVLRYATFPYALFLFGIVYPSRWFRQFRRAVAMEQLIRAHRFRVLGVFFLLLAFFGALPLPFALMAGLGDLLTALSSPLVARAWQQQRPNARRLVLLWNTFGLLDIVATAIAANVLTYWALTSGTAGVDVLGQFPFCLIPAFAPPTIVLLHVCVYQRLR